MQVILRSLPDHAEGTQRYFVENIVTHACHALLSYAAVTSFPQDTAYKLLVAKTMSAADSPIILMLSMQ